MARAHFGPGALTAPLPAVMVTVGDMEKSNIITVGWTGILSTHPARTYVSVRPSRHSHGMLRHGGEFVINLTRAEQARAVDYAGVFTGAKVDKFAVLGLTKLESKTVAPPTIAECPVSLECRVVEVIPMGTHDVFIADILSVSADEEILDERGKICFERAGLLAYAHGEYFALGERLGSFGFSAKKKKVDKSKTPIAEKAGVKTPILKKQNSKGTAAKPEAGRKQVAHAPEDKERGEEKRRPFYLDAPRGRNKRTKGEKRR